MGVEELLRRLAGYRTVALDTKVFSYHTQFPNLHIVPLDLAVAREAALVRGETGLRTPDAIQVAAARLAGADVILTNDRRWIGRVSRPPVLLLDDYAG